MWDGGEGETKESVRWRRGGLTALTLTQRKVRWQRETEREREGEREKTRLLAITGEWDQHARLSFRKEGLKLAPWSIVLQQWPIHGKYSSMSLGQIYWADDQSDCWVLTLLHTAVTAAKVVFIILDCECFWGKAIKHTFGELEHYSYYRFISHKILKRNPFVIIKTMAVFKYLFDW